MRSRAITARPSDNKTPPDPAICRRPTNDRFEEAVPLVGTAAVGADQAFAAGALPKQRR
jgi:hypothetical protein